MPILWESYGEYGGGVLFSEVRRGQALRRVFEEVESRQA